MDASDATNVRKSHFPHSRSGSSENRRVSAKGTSMQIFSFRQLAVVAALFLTLGGFANAVAQTAKQLTAEESDPKMLGWMQGFPPPPDKLIAQPDSNYFSFPKLH